MSELELPKIRKRQESKKSWWMRSLAPIKRGAEKEGSRYVKQKDDYRKQFHKNFKKYAGEFQKDIKRIANEISSSTQKIVHDQKKIKGGKK
ncbi:MAG: hypothetical protein KJ767_04065 [Nanoarchaeota archaeon]|nr:hypothetical protein [Nanoarchaeota archaeon]